MWVTLHAVALALLPVLTIAAVTKSPARPRLTEIAVAALFGAAVFMILAVALIVGGLLWATREQALVPGRSQAVAEMLHEFIAGTLQDAAGREGMKFFPLVFSLFMFVLTLNLLGMIPGLGGIKKQLEVDGDLDEDFFKRVEAIIYSMTPEERRHPEMINGSRRRRIAKGSGSTPQDINQLLKQFHEAKKIMKVMSNPRGGRGPFRLPI